MFKTKFKQLVEVNVTAMTKIEVFWFTEDLVIINLWAMLNMWKFF